MPTPDQKPPFSFRLEFPPELPISARAEEIIAAIRDNPVVILSGETGSGKTTQIPKLCLAAGGGTRGLIACTQPRRVAALSVSRRVAEELGVEWGGPVGCKIRFDDHTSRETVIKFLTDGMLLAEVQGDPLLRGYDTIIIDEAHERSLNIDFLLGHLRTLRFKRPELKIVITSATIDTEAFSAAFDGAPIIQVSGRTYPVEVVYSPLDGLGSDYVDDPDEPDRTAERSAKLEALHYVDGAAGAVERIFRETSSGDILVFLPSERDIREVRSVLEEDGPDGRLKAELVPLFGRLSNAEQQRVFSRSSRRKVILATNIAETSLTIPGIRYVVDTGLARLSRYSPQARTRRLPIEPVSQSSADQRKGRAGRVAEGVCIRLYSEQDYEERPRFTQPEIQRANLADVILRLKAFGLGDVERFPFINPPAGKAIRAGYTLLEELGALDVAGKSESSGGDAALGAASRRLTAVGQELARMPVDPTVGRMILQARREKCLREVVIIAAGLSVQDPRERPLEKQASADAAHRRFRHPDSDFLTLLAIWEAYHDQFERLSQARLRRFCHEQFLSYVRMREWRDIYAQLTDVLEQRADFRMTSVEDGWSEATAESKEASLRFGGAAYRAIHRSVLAGLLGNVAQYDEENRSYKATHDRRVVIFPGSGLFRREEPRKRGGEGSAATKKPAAKLPRWIMASEIVETSRLYARTCARLDPSWVADLGAHIIKTSHSEPFWNQEAGRVMVKQRSRLYGLEMDARAVSYGRINPVHATEIFIREALVNDTLSYPFDFLAHNRKVRERVESILTRTRDTGYLNLDETLYRFYAHTLMPTTLEVEEALRSGTPAGVSSVPELIDLVRHRRGENPDFLQIEPEDLRDPEELSHDGEAFPENLPLENRAIPLHYTYKPGQEDDGVNVEINVRDAEALSPSALDWAVPGHLAAKVEHLLRALPKDQRRLFVPLAESVKTVTEGVQALARLRDYQGTLTTLLAEHLHDRFGIRVDPLDWQEKPIPDHLRVRVRVTDDQGQVLVASRDLTSVKAELVARAQAASVAVVREDPDAWRRARQKWEKPEATQWTFGELPARVAVSDQAGVPIHAYPCLTAGDLGVAVRLARTEAEARVTTQKGLSHFLELQLRYELAWLQKELKALRTLGALTATLATSDQLAEDAYVSIRRWIVDPTRVKALTSTAFLHAVEEAKRDLRGIVPRLTDRLREILSLRQALLVAAQAYPGQARDLAGLLPTDFLRIVPYERLVHLPRYLRAMGLRAERWKQNPAKDAERAQVLAPYVAAVEKRRFDDPVRWLVEEFRVSLFAQELGTAESVSSVKLDRALAQPVVVETSSVTKVDGLQREKEKKPETPPIAPSKSAPTPPSARKAALKDLSALAAHFRK
ncbi:MAG TPA: ATP-dependent RNA helicase HrpA [Opitutaceae bacterium]|nr:ATP-dependent RNA helicase HrpA [Opitutaceae bacterium]